jgi:hypothetical protein
VDQSRNDLDRGWSWLVVAFFGIHALDLFTPDRDGWAVASAVLFVLYGLRTLRIEFANRRRRRVAER